RSPEPGAAALSENRRENNRDPDGCSCGRPPLQPPAPSLLHNIVRWHTREPHRCCQAKTPPCNKRWPCHLRVPPSNLPGGVKRFEIADPAEALFRPSV